LIKGICKQTKDKEQTKDREQNKRKDLPDAN
jgi:hypothetical protein